MMYNNVEMKVLIKGKPITEYTHRGLTYVEGREGSEYELELKNNHSTRVEVIISVDGLSIIDGKAAGPESTGYLLNAYQKAVIPGWMVDQATAAKFKFGGKDGSYSTGVTGSSVNNGVIGMMIYSEKQKPIQYINHITTSAQSPWETFGSGVSSPLGALRGYMSNSGDISNIMSNSIMASVSSYAASGAVSTDSYSKSAEPKEEKTAGGTLTQNNLGTEFGAATDFKTTSVTFERQDMIGMFVIYYDNARGLRSRGIEVSRNRNTPHTPDAFPGMATGCKPPKNWKK